MGTTKGTWSGFPNRTMGCMNFLMWEKYKKGQLAVLLGSVVGGTCMVMASPPSLNGLSGPGNEVPVTVQIQARQFQPASVQVEKGQKTRLIIQNKDAELHAFVPKGLLSKMSLQVSGNGAPEFGKEGLIRVLLPSNGQTEIVFTPKELGVYPYLCDLPGHVMTGSVVVGIGKDMVE